MTQPNTQTLHLGKSVIPSQTSDMLEIQLEQVIGLYETYTKLKPEGQNQTPNSVPLYSDKAFQSSVLGLGTIGLNSYGGEYNLQTNEFSHDLKEKLTQFISIREQLKRQQLNKDQRAILDTGCFFAAKLIQKCYLESHGIQVDPWSKQTSFAQNLVAFKEKSVKDHPALNSVLKRYLFHNIFVNQSKWKKTYDTLATCFSIIGFFCAIAAFLMILFTPHLTLPILICTYCSWMGLLTVVLSGMEWLKNCWYGLSNITKEVRNDILLIAVAAGLGFLLTFLGLPSTEYFKTLPTLFQKTSTLWPLLADVIFGIMNLFKGVFYIRAIRDTAGFYHNPEIFTKIATMETASQNLDVKIKPSAVVAYMKQTNVFDEYHRSMWWQHPCRHHRKLAKKLSEELLSSRSGGTKLVTSKTMAELLASYSIKEEDGYKFQKTKESVDLETFLAAIITCTGTTKDAKLKLFYDYLTYRNNGGRISNEKSGPFKIKPSGSFARRMQFAICTYEPPGGAFTNSS